MTEPGGVRAGRVVLSLFVPGTPRPQGSGTAMVSRSTGAAFKKTPQTTAAWRNQLAAAFLAAGVKMIPPEAPVAVEVEFRFARPKAHSKRRRATDDGLKANGADIDKLARLVLDALSVARVYDDDRQVTDLMAAKRYVTADDQPEGVMVVVISGVELDGSDT